MLANLTLLILGFIFLIKGAGFLVDGASSLAKKFKISNLAIGLTIVAFGTSLPELIVNILSNFKNSADLAIGNAIGANISNILLVGGIAAIVYPIKIKSNTTWREIPLGLLAIAILIILANNLLLNSGDSLAISRWDGIILLGFFLIFIYYTLGIAKAKKNEHSDFTEHRLPLSLAYIVIGIVGLCIGGNWVVGSATSLAKSLGVSQALIGLTVISIGSTLPEIITSATAAFKKNADFAVGNIIGSIIFNTSFILGVSALIRPLAFNAQLNIDITVLIIATFVLFYFVLTGKRKGHIERYEGIGLVCAYLIYLVFLLWRG
ncbi:MAG: sodium:calcium antiporter [Patescibacteria group bacterium]